METLYFLKFWKPNTTSTTATPSVEIVVEEEEDDSFFDLELSFDVMYKTTPESNKLDSETMPKPNKAGFSKSILCLSPADSISKRKILPIEPISKPQSPIALLKSAPKFRTLMFKKPKATATKKTGEAAESRASMETQKERIKESNLFSVKMLIGEETPNPSKLTRESSSRQNRSSEDLKTERSIQKYLNLIKPLYSKVSKRNTEKAVNPFIDVALASPASSPAVSMCPPRKKQGNTPAGFRDVCKSLGKSKSSTAVMSPANRRDDSLLLQNDGIQSAILHCKRSFNSSRDSASLSRSASDSSSMNSFSTDSSMLSRFASESHDKSARSSIEE